MFNAHNINLLVTHWLRRWRYLVLAASLLFLGILLNRGHAWSQSDASLQLSGTQPTSGTENVLTDSVIRFEFAQTLDPKIQRITLSVQPETKTIFDIKDNQLLVKAQDRLRYSTEYTFVLSPQDNLPLSAPIELKFKTEPQYTYARDVKPLLDASCVGCHQFGGRQRNQLLDSYSAVLAYVTPGDPNSVLIDPKWTGRHAPVRNANNPNLPRTGSPELAYIRRLGTPLSRLGLWTAEEVEIVKTWIVQDQAVESSGS